MDTRSLQFQDWWHCTMPVIVSWSIQSNGKFLCKTVIDELPHIWCIFTGQMSVIGPVNFKAATI
nr:sugar transferase [Cloacibacillus evryensis]